MDEEEFWKCIEHIDRELLGQEGYDSDAVEPLINCLSELMPSKIQGFEEQLSQHLYQLDTRRHRQNSGESSTSVDGFLYARCFVVANGKDYFQKILNDPDLSPKTLDEWCEPLLYVAAKAWERSGQESEWNYYASVSYETGMNRAGYPPEDM